MSFEISTLVQAFILILLITIIIYTVKLNSKLKLFSKEFDNTTKVIMSINMKIDNQTNKEERVNQIYASISDLLIRYQKHINEFDNYAVKIDTKMNHLSIDLSDLLKEYSSTSSYLHSNLNSIKNLQTGIVLIHNDIKNETLEIKKISELVRHMHEFNRKAQRIMKLLENQ